MPSPMPLVEPVTIADLPASPLVERGASVGEVIRVMVIAFVQRANKARIEEERDPDDAGGRGRGAPSGSHRAEAAGERPSAEEFVAGRCVLMSVPKRSRQ